MTDHLTALRASKRKSTRQRDNWKARAMKYREALEQIYVLSKCSWSRLLAQETLAKAEKTEET
jgi:hypothetical protein